jgi:hypothetical protein
MSYPKYFIDREVNIEESMEIIFYKPLGYWKNNIIKKFIPWRLVNRFIHQIYATIDPSDRFFFILDLVGIVKYSFCFFEIIKILFLSVFRKIKKIKKKNATFFFF